MSTTIVCPLTGDPAAERALPSAFDAASTLKGTLELFSAVEDPHMVSRREKYLTEIGTQGRPTGTPAPSIEVVVDPHAPRALAERMGSPDVIAVMATSTQPIMHTGYMGSAAERVARDSHAPALLIGPHNNVRLCDVDRIVVPCDGSPLSETILRPAKEWSTQLDIPLWIVTSLSPRDTKHVEYNAAAEGNYVRRLADAFGAEWEVLHGSDPAKAVVQWAGPAMIAMTTHGRSGLSRLAIGSVAVGITRWATGPVLVGNGENTP